jgi:predicted nuclease of predicted toxin-antitoxin system
VRLLLDEHISPALVGLLAEINAYAQSVPHVGLAGRADHVVWQYALDHDFAVVTTNAQDFIELLDVPIHPGLIVLRESGLSQQEQWERVRPVVEHVKKSGDEDFLLNKLIEITGVERFEITRHSRTLKKFAMKERALAKVLPIGTPFRRFQANDTLLAFLESL